MAGTSKRLAPGAAWAAVLAFSLGGSGCGGGEPTEAPEEVAASEAPALATFSCPTTRATTDRADGNTLYKVKFLYVLPSDGVDRFIDTNGAICRSVQAQYNWFTSQTTNGAALRYDVSGSVLDIQFVRLSKTDAQMKGTANNSDLNTGHAYVRDRIERELKALGHLKDTRKLYAVYYGGTSELSCGGAAWPPALIGKVVALYLNGLPNSSMPCSANPLGSSSTTPAYIDYAMLHETLHGLGYVADAAPNEHATGHVYDSARDLMYAPRAGTSDPYWDTYNPLGLVLDHGRNQYYLHGGTQPDLARSAFLNPLPASPLAPPGW
ncbi:hypothetical protein P2318_29825 [Myxococcaceae bacterium GXIMD 01537]